MRISDWSSDVCSSDLKLAGGVAVIRVGGATEVEVKERKDCVDDAMHATRAAVEEGIVPGGGVAVLHAVKALEGVTPGNDEERKSGGEGKSVSVRVELCGCRISKKKKSIHILQM